MNSPNAIPGNNANKCDTASAAFQSEEAGTVDGVGTAQSLRRYAERYVAQSVLASCYAARESLAMQFRDNAARTLSGLRLAATLSDRVDCWL